MVTSESFSIDAQAHESEWDEFVASRPDATGYHLWRWRRVFEDAFGHDTEYLAAREGGPSGPIGGILPLVQFDSRVFGRFMVSLPFVNYGGLVAGHAGAAEALMSAAVALSRERGLGHIELRHRERLLPELAVKEHKVGMRLALEKDEARAWSALDRKVRNQIKKAEKSGLKAEDSGAGRLDDFYPVFAQNMRDLGTPVYGRSFFASVLERFPHQTRVHVVRHEGRAVAAAISYAYRDTIEVPWASSLREYRAMCPNNLLYWHVIRHAIANGFATLDFGRSTNGEGTFHFKRQWGAEPSPLFWEYALNGGSSLPDQSPANPKFQTAIAVWKRLPVSFTTWLGPHIVRSIP